MNINLKYFLMAAIFTVTAVYGLFSLMEWAVNAPEPQTKEPQVYMSRDGKMFTVVGIVALKDMNENITIVDVDTFEKNYYKVP